MTRIGNVSSGGSCKGGTWLICRGVTDRQVGEGVRPDTYKLFMSEAPHSTCYVGYFTFKLILLIISFPFSDTFLYFIHLLPSSPLLTFNLMVYFILCLPLPFPLWMM